MISDRKLKANKRNASRSTGPRTLGGKQRSRNNALRHGLARPIDLNFATAQNIERLARILAGFSNELWRNEHARTIAECYFDMQRIRAARTAVLQRIGELEAAGINEHALSAHAIEKINRYERRVLSKRRKAFQALHNPSPGVVANDTRDRSASSTNSLRRNSESVHAPVSLAERTHGKDHAFGKTKPPASGDQ